MGKRNGALIMIENIRQVQTMFLNSSSEQRINYINNFERLLPYERTALMQCKKFMTPEEKRVYFDVVKKISERQNKTSEPPQNI